MRLLIIHGPTASGKLTVARQLAKISGAIVFHNHLTVNLCREIFEHGTEEYYALIEKLRLIVIEDAISKGENDIIFTFFYWGSDPRDVSFVNKLIEVAKENSAEIYFLGLNPSVESLRQRVNSETRKALGKPSNIDEFNKATQGWKFSNILHTNSFVIDNTNLTVDQVCEYIFIHMIT